jgi:hypothetical protein
MALTATTKVFLRKLLKDNNAADEVINNLEAVEGLSNSELGFLDGVTAGTVAASKAVVVDSNKDAASVRNFAATGQVRVGTATASNFTTAGAVIATAGFAVGDVLNAVIDDATHGSGSTQLFIGNSTIDVTAPSDQRLKEHVRATDVNATALLSQIEMVDYFWKDKAMGAGRQFGWIAQQVHEVLPNVAYASQEGTFFVHQNNLVPYLVKAVQELSSRLAALEGK